MFHLKSKWLALLAGALVATGSAFAQDSGPLIDLLVKKGIVTDQEAEELRVDLVKDFVSNTSAGKMNLSSSITELKFSGDLRMRYEYNAQVPELAAGAAAVANETSRQRFRLRFNTDILLQKGWNTGFGLETGQASDSANQTFTNAADDYAVFFSKAYIGWQMNPNLGFVIGKQKNPMYTTDLRWDADINPQGLYENYKAFFGVKDTLEARVMQHAMQDNNEQIFGPTGTDAWMFEQQAVYTHWFGTEKLNSVIFALGYTAYNQSVIPAGPANSAAFVGSVRAQKYGTFAGEANWVGVNGAGTTFKLYWDSSMNFEGSTRAYRVYGLNPALFSKGDTAWLAGVGYSFGTGKVQGDYSLKLDYRSVGITSIDPNTNDSDWGFSKLNEKGFKLALAYNINDFTNFNIAYFDTQIIQHGMTFALGNLDKSHEVLIDLVVKF